jgi:hypothetical protein
MDIDYCSIFGLHNFFVTQPKSAVEKNQHSDKDKEICRHQPSSPAAASHCPFTQMLPLTFVAVA